ncbi:MAG: cyclically-permuted mutarotase family protein [Bacteroidales bacterium]|nr:cyclically-permuted mutarotase family protein [Bacteroidales bacterium]
MQAAADRTFNSARFGALPQLRVSGEQGVSAPFAGVSNGVVLVAGGCNFPDVPAAEGGRKVFYSDVYALEAAMPQGGWRKVGQLPDSVAYGVSVSVPDGVAVIGGTNGRQSLATALLLSYSRGKTAVSSLPPLPVGLDNMAGAYGGGYIYVAGGQTDGVAANRAFRLKWPGGSEWERLPDFPGKARLQPVAAVQSGAERQMFYLLGGYSADGTNGGGLCYDPLYNRWRETSDIAVDGKAVALVGASAVNSGTSFIVCIGGVDRDIFNQALKGAAPGYMLHEPEWYRFRTTLLIYNTITDSWSEMEGAPALARAGSGVVDYADGGTHRWLVICGESKPGVRSADATSVSVSYDASFGWLNWLVLIVYLLAMLWLGFYFMHREKNSDDFFTGGGRIPWWAAGMSIFATMLSAITYMSIPAKAYATDWKYYPMQIFILIVAFPVITSFLPFFRRLKISTAYAYLEQRFCYGVRAMASALFIIFMVARMALVLFLPSLAMSAVTGIDIFLCIILMSAITIAYCTMGGMEAVVWGDVVQGFILIGGALLAAVFLVTQTEGGASGFWDIGMANDKFVLFDFSFDFRSATFWVIVLGGLANNLISYTSDQTVIQRYMTTSSEKAASKSIITNGFLSIFVSIIFYTIGTGLYTFFKTHPAAIDVTMQKTDAIFPFFMMSQLPAGLAGLLIAALFAATMSTISSNINSISTAFTMDMYKKWRPQIGDRKTLSVARWTGIVAGLIGTLIAIVMAVADIQSLLDYFNTILGLLTGAIGGLFIMGIFFKRINAATALIGFIAGTLAVFYMNYFTDANFLLFGFISMFVSVAVALVLSLFSRNRKDIKGLTWKTLDKINSK